MLFGVNELLGYSAIGLLFNLLGHLISVVLFKDRLNLVLSTLELKRIECLDVLLLAPQPNAL